MLNIRKKKKWFIVIFLLVVLGTFFYLWLQKSEFLSEEIRREKFPGEFRGDTFEPASQIKKPISGSWQNKDFFFETLDEDLESGLDKTSCQYKVLSYAPNGQEQSSGWRNRKCNSLSLVGVGVEKWCPFEGERSCWIFISSRDKAQNQHLSSEEKGSVQYYHIDWTSPDVEKVSIEGEKAQARVTDNFKITGCNLYLDGKDLGPMTFSAPGCQRECSAFKTFSTDFEPGEHQLWAVCRDAAQNYGKGEELVIKENLPPQISSCRVTPSQGTVETQFQFKLDAHDADGDTLTFLWEFGDGESSQEFNPSHRYIGPGTFTPKVKVLDAFNGEASCSTAWAVVGE